MIVTARAEGRSGAGGYLDVPTGEDLVDGLVGAGQQPVPGCTIWVRAAGEAGQPGQWP